MSYASKRSVARNQVRRPAVDVEVATVTDKHIIYRGTYQGRLRLSGQTHWTRKRIAQAEYEELRAEILESRKPEPKPKKEKSEKAVTLSANQKRRQHKSALKKMTSFIKAFGVDVWKDSALERN